MNTASRLNALVLAMAITWRAIEPSVNRAMGVGMGGAYSGMDANISSAARGHAPNLGTRRPGRGLRPLLQASCHPIQYLLVVYHLTQAHIDQCLLGQVSACRNYKSAS